VTLLVAELELRTALARRRLFLLNVSVPLLLVIPIVLAAAPPFHAAAVYTVLFMLFGTFGSAIPLVRDAEAGLIERILLTGLLPADYLLQRSGTGTLVDALQLFPAVVVAALGMGGSPASIAGLWLTLTTSLWIANLVGVIVASVARSLAETALFSAVTALMILHISGVFRTPSPGSVGATLEGVAPFRALHEGILSLSGGAVAGGSTALLCWAFGLPVATALLARVLASALRAVERGR
jgi:hypothetical protein